MTKKRTKNKLTGPVPASFRMLTNLEYLDLRTPLCVRCGSPEAEKLDARDVCQDCAHERKERAVIKWWITLECNDSIERVMICSEIGDNCAEPWEAGYRCALETLRIWLDSRDRKERGR